MRIADGVMAGYEAIFQAKIGKDRVTILLRTAERTARVEVSVDHIEPVTPD